MQLDGKQFFYVNPLEVIPGISGNVQTHKHALPQRPKWYACACCPPNVSRLLMSLGRYAWGEGIGTLYAHMFMGGIAHFDLSGGVEVKCVSKYPYDSNVIYTFSPKSGIADFKFAVHIPGWCKNVVYIINGKREQATVVTDGYAYFTRTWTSGDTLQITFDLPVLRIYSNTSVSGNAGKVCLQRGPFVYCFEQADNKAPLAALRLPVDSIITPVTETAGVLSGVVALQMNGLAETCDDDLYTEEKPKAEAVTLKAVPYYTWGNRCIGEMRVWIRE